MRRCRGRPRTRGAAPRAAAAASAAICSCAGLRASADGARDLAWRSRPARAPRRQSSIGIDTNAGPAGGRLAWWIAWASANGTSAAREGSWLHFTNGLGTSIASRLVRFACMRHQRARLLPGGYEQRRLVGPRVEDRADAVAEPRRGVQVDVRDFAACLSETIRHANGDRLLQAEHVAEVLGERAEHRQLGRAGVAEDRGHPVSAEQFEGRFADCGHRGLSGFQGVPGARASLGADLPMKGRVLPSKRRPIPRLKFKRAPDGAD